MKHTKLFAALAVGALCILSSGSVFADSQYKTGTGALSADAHVDFQVTVPKVLYLRVGTGSAYGAADTATIDLIDFTVPAANLGDGTAIAASATSGDLGNGAVTARLIANGGDVTFTSTTAGPLSTGTAGETISYDQISTTVATLTSTVALPHPTLVDGATTTTTVSPTSGKIVNRDATWTYKYLNQAVVGAGTYGGVDTNNSRATYTASIL